MRQTFTVEIEYPDTLDDVAFTPPEPRDVAVSIGTAIEREFHRLGISWTVDRVTARPA